MSHRASFSIRKLIKTWPDNDDNNGEAGELECSSARTIRVQYELEQYQTQHVHQQARHEGHRHRSWMNNSAGSAPTTTKSHKNGPKPTAVATSNQQPTGNAVAKRPSASRRISMPLASSQQPSRISPATPLRSSQESVFSRRAGGVFISQQSQQSQFAQARLAQARRPSRAAGIPSPRSSQVEWEIRNGPSSAPLSQGPSPRVNDTRFFPVTGTRSRDQRLSSARHPSPTLPANSRPHDFSQAPIITMTSADTATNRSNRFSYVMNGHIQQKPSAFAHGQPSPPLEPDDFLTGVFDSSDILREMPSVSTLSLSSENHWFDEDSNQVYDVSDNVQQLIRETDEAFKAVSSALNEARMFPHSPPPSMENLKSPLQHLQHASQVLHEQAATAKPRPTPKMQIETASPISPTPLPGAGRGSIAPRCRKGSKPDTSLFTKASNTSKAPVIVANSIAKPKKGPKSPTPTPTPKAMVSVPRESSTPAKVLARGTVGHKHGHHGVHKSISKLNQAADKVTDKLFEGRAGRFGFLRIEADELVMPEQIEEFRQKRLANEAAEAARSTETLDIVADVVAGQSDGDVDIDAKCLHNLPPRIGHAGINALSPVIEVATPDFFELNKAVMGDLPILATKESRRAGQDPLVTPPPTPPQHPSDTDSEDEDSMNLKNLGLSKLAQRRPAHKRSGSSVSHIALLPTIPEVKIKSPLPWDASRISGSQSPEFIRQRPAPTDANGNPYFEEDEEHMFFRSNPVTATMPTIQHGRIRLAKADLVNAGTINSLESKLLLSSPDETLDWTAFQMAILGGAGDLFSDPDNFLSRDAQEEMVDDLCDWLEDLEYTNSDLGALIDSYPPRKISVALPRTPNNLVTPGSVNRSFHDPTQRHHHVHRQKSHSNASSLSSLGSGLTRSGDSPDHSILIAVESEHPSGFWNSTTSEAAQHSDSERFHGGPRLKRWTLEGHPKRYHGASSSLGIDVHKANNGLGLGKPLPMTPQAGASADEVSALGGPRRPLKSDRGAGTHHRSRTADAAHRMRESIDSLPQSPMLELRMTTGVDGSKEFVSMGYNLNHDLGDFLKWESEHVYASGFYGADE